MGFWKWHPDKKTKRDHEAGSLSASSGSAATHSTSPASFSISPPATTPGFRPYVKVAICHRYWETGMPLPWPDAHLPNGWHVSPHRVPIPPVRRAAARASRRSPVVAPGFRVSTSPTVGRARHAPANFFVGRAHRPPRVSQSAPRVCASSPTRARGLTLMPSPFPSPPPPPPQPPTMMSEEEERLVHAVMEDFEREHKRCQEEECEGLQEMLELSAVGDVCVSELDVKQEVKMEVKEEATEERAWAPWSPPPSPPPQNSPVQLWEPPPHLWTPHPTLTWLGDDEDSGA
uniref:Uncharacterized protein n=1 Tax=Triticum aestivum TaxID=4565 RepID=F5CPR7_WHEAT|nr:hypothetical protein TAANSRALLhA_515O12.g00003 [Triticum aestivum]